MMFSKFALVSVLAFCFPASGSGTLHSKHQQSNFTNLRASRYIPSAHDLQCNSSELSQLHNNESGRSSYHFPMLFCDTRHSDRNMAPSEFCYYFPFRIQYYIHNRPSHPGAQYYHHESRNKRYSHNDKFRDCGTSWT